MTARLKMKKRGSDLSADMKASSSTSSTAKKSRSGPPKVTTSTPVSYKSRQVTVKSPATKKSTKRKNIVVKRKRAESSSDEDVGQDVCDIIPPSQKRKMSGKKIPPNIPAAPLDNISFHSEQSAQRWRYVYQRRIARERESCMVMLSSARILCLC